jgi:glycosyltransferase involved in cell wall biosynthesis
MADFPDIFMTKISIALTTYNGAAMLPAQLASFAKQERLPDELVVCDDCSTDGTVSVLEQFAATAPFPVRITVNDLNLGHEANFAKVVDLCEGDIIFLADQDDSWFPSRLSRVEQAYLEHPHALVIVNDVMIADGNLEPLGRTVTEQMRGAGVIGANAKSLTLGCATSFKRELKRFISPIPQLDYGHDSWIHDFSEHLGARRVLFDVLQLYRRHENNASTWAFTSKELASPAVVMRPTAGKDISPAYVKRLRALRLMRERVGALGTNEHDLLNGNLSYTEVIRRIDGSIGAHERRLKLIRDNWIRRKLMALHLGARGDYRYFLGWRSFAKDLIR